MTNVGHEQLVQIVARVVKLERWSMVLLLAVTVDPQTTSMAEVGTALLTVMDVLEEVLPLLAVALALYDQLGKFGWDIQVFHKFAVKYRTIDELLPELEKAVPVLIEKIQAL